jgi:hypothetical protein
MAALLIYAQHGLLAKLHDVLDEVLEDRQAQPLPSPRQAGVIR